MNCGYTALFPGPPMSDASNRYTPSPLLTAEERCFTGAISTEWCRGFPVSLNEYIHV